jgi:EAL domain-containing protein (putative c-di-GMP-specific phosphodiesterase class I)
MREVFAEGDLLFRIGGDEFAVIRTGVAIEASAETARRLLHFASRPSGDGRPCTFSCGISSMPRHGTDPTLLYRQADAALYWVKRHGRASVELFDPERDSVDQASFKSVDSAVYEVVRGRLLTPVFQPIVDLGTGSIIGFEGLIRPDPAGPLPDPGRLFAAAVTTGRTVELDIACLAVVSAGAHALRRDQLLSVNLSPRTLEIRTFEAAWLLDGLQRHGIDPRRVIVELTERDAIADLGLLRRNFEQLQQYGIRFAADDVGAGNSGLRLLSQLRFDVVKIDLTLVQEGVAKLGSREVLRSIRDLARRQEALVIAEGVETPEQLRVVRELGISAGQGYLLGRPSAAVDVSAVELESLMPEPPEPGPSTEGVPADPRAQAPRSPLILPGAVEWPSVDLARPTRARALPGGVGAALRR